MQCTNLFLGTFKDDATLIDFAELGVYCQFDIFGNECSLYQFDLEFDMLSDAQRMQQIINLVKEGYEDHILMAHDIHTKHRLVSFLFNHKRIKLFVRKSFFIFCFSLFLLIDWLWWTWICAHFEQYFAEASNEGAHR